LKWSAITELLPSAFVIALISFMEATSSCKVIAIKTRTRWDENQELIGQGLAKIAAAFCHSMPVSGSFSRSAINLASNARTGVSSLVSAACVLLTLMFFTPLLYHLPKPALAAMIILAIANLVNFPAMRHAWPASRDDGIAGTDFISSMLIGSLRRVPISNRLRYLCPVPSAGSLVTCDQERRECRKD
jgi:SulP family sulfate permease